VAKIGDDLSFLEAAQSSSRPPSRSRRAGEGF
jgi:hypothetical protein